jgi:hypothetical protein
MAELLIGVAIAMMVVFWLISVACERELRRETEDTLPRKKAA